MILGLGALLATKVLQRSAWRWALAFLVLGALMLLVQLKTFPDSSHIEFPWIELRNGWDQDFVWIREHTPAGAPFRKKT